MPFLGAVVQSLNVRQMDFRRHRARSMASQPECPVRRPSAQSPTISVQPLRTTYCATLGILLQELYPGPTRTGSSSARALTSRRPLICAHAAMVSGGGYPLWRMEGPAFEYVARNSSIPAVRNDEDRVGLIQTTLFACAPNKSN